MKTLEYPLQDAEGFWGVVKERIHKSMGKIVVIDNINFVSTLLKTSSGKTMRGLIIVVLAGHSLENDLTKKTDSSRKCRVPHEIIMSLENKGQSTSCDH